MPDAFGAFLAGGAQARAENDAAAAAKAEAKAKAAEIFRDQFNKDRTNALNVAKQSQVIKGAAEDEWARLEATISAPDWDSAGAISAMATAQRIDDTYGEVLGGKSAQKHFAQRLNLVPGTKPGVAGPVTKNQNAGYTGPAQRLQAEAKTKKLQTEKMLAGLESQAINYVLKNASTPDDIIDPTQMPMAFLAFESQILAELGQDADYTMVSTALDNAFDALSGAGMKVAASTMDPAEIAEQQRKVSKDVEYYVKSRYGMDDGLGNFTFFEGTSAGHQMVSNTGQRMVKYGWDLPTIKIKLSRRFVKKGKWPDGNMASMNDLKLSVAPPEFAEAVQQAFESGAVDPREVEVVYDPDTGRGGLIDLASANWVGGAPGAPLFGARSGVTFGDTPPPADGPKPKKEEPKEEKKQDDGNVQLDHKGRRPDEPGYNLIKDVKGRIPGDEGYTLYSGDEVVDFLKNPIEAFKRNRAGVQAQAQASLKKIRENETKLAGGG